MERQTSESRVLQEISETNLSTKFTSDLEKLAVLDAFVQFSQNPTSKSARYGIEENFPLIGQNLAKRYDLRKVTIETLLTFLKESVSKMREANYDIYFWREAVADHIKEKYAEEFFKWYRSLYTNLSEEEKRKFIFLLNALTRTSSIREIHKWFTCFFDKEERSSEGDLSDLLVKFGMGDVLYYRSSSGYGENQFVSSLFLKNLCKKFEQEIPVEEKQVEEFFDYLSLTNTKLLEKCVKETVPVLESRTGKVTQTSHLILEASRSYFGVSPFALDKFRELVKAKKLELTREWKEKFGGVLNSFVKEVYPCAELKIIFEIEGAYCWEIRYTDSPEKEPISIGILLSPYLFIVSGYSTILDEMRRIVSSSQLNLILLMRETLPTITESFRYVSQKNLIFLLDERGEEFYLIERSEKLPEDKTLIIDSFFSRFQPMFESEFRISRTWPSRLKDYMENLRYLNKFPRLVNIRNRIPRVELKLRKTIRDGFEKNYGDEWKEKIKEKLPEKVKKLESVIEKRPDKKEIKDFLDGATLGELLEITTIFPSILGIDRSAMGHLNVITRHRKTLEHPLKDQESDLNERTYKMLKIAMDYVEEVICSE